MYFSIDVQQWVKVFVLDFAKLVLGFLSLNKSLASFTQVFLKKSMRYRYWLLNVLVRGV